MTKRDLVRHLETAEYKPARDNGTHTIYAKQGCSSGQVPQHKEINENTADAILKAAGLK